MNDLCKRIQKQLTKMHLGKQPIDDDPQVQAHLDTCAQCRLHLDRLRHDFQELRVDADSLDEYVDQFKSKVAQTTQEVQAQQPSSPSRNQDSKTKVWVGSTVILIIGLYLTWPFLTGKKTDSEPSVPASNGQMSIQRARPANTSLKQTGEKKLAQELQLAEQLYSQRNIEGLMALLDTGLNQTKQTAAVYLANIGDRNTLLALQTRAQTWDASDGINPFTKAITRIQRKMARSASAGKRSSSPSEGSSLIPTMGGLIEDPNGSPIPGARIYTALKGQPVPLMAPTQDQPSAATDASGTFSLAAQSDIKWIVVTHDHGVAVITPEELGTADAIVLAPWASIKGDLYLDSQPVIGYTLKAMSAGVNKTFGYLCQTTAQTDELGQFLLQRVVPGNVSLLHDTHEVAPGQTLELHINANARAIKGRFRVTGEATPSWDTGFVPDIVPLPPNIEWSDLDRPEDYEEMTLDEVAQWCSEFVQTPPTAPGHFQLQADDTGEFQLSQIPAGQYALHGQLFGTDSGQASESLLGRVWHVFEIPESGDPSQLNRVIDLGDINLIPGHLNPGDMAPGFDLPTFGEERIILRDYRGEFVLLSFYSLDNLAPDDPHTRELASIHRIYGTYAQFAIIGMLSSPVHPLITKKTLDEADLDWAHALLRGPSSLSLETTAEGVQYQSQQHLEYDVPGPQPWNMLISPDGHVLEIGLQGQDLVAVLEASLAEGAEL